jgi:hypothetical protein
VASVAEPVSGSEPVPLAAYDGLCNLCGWEGRFESDAQPFRVGQQFKCGGCASALRFRDEAVVLLHEFGRGLHLTLDQLVDDPWFRDHSVYYVGERGPVRRRLAGLPHYVESRYTPDATLGEVVAHDVTVQDLQRLTFADESFDLVASSHVMEHVPDPWQALREVRRVLRPGGRYVFSVPWRNDVLVETLVRAVAEPGGVRHLRDPIYHDAPDGASLVFHEFGADLVERTRACGLSARVVRPHLPVRIANRDVVVVATRNS